MQKLCTEIDTADVVDRDEGAWYSMNANPSKKVGIEKKVRSMKLSTKGRYGLRAIIDLARYGEEEPVSIGSIAGRQDISERYLEQLMALLKKAGLVTSIRGAGGGYVLAKEADTVSVGDVLRALEGDLEPVRCGAFHEEEGCQGADSCVTKYVWQKINNSINETVDEIKLSELVWESRVKNPAGNSPGPQCVN